MKDKDEVIMYGDARSYEEKVAIAQKGIETLSLTERRVLLKHRIQEAFGKFLDNPTGDNFIVLTVQMCGYQHVKKNEKMT